MELNRQKESLYGASTPSTRRRIRRTLPYREVIAAKTSLSKSMTEEYDGYPFGVRYHALTGSRWISSGLLIAHPLMPEQADVADAVAGDELLEWWHNAGSVSHNVFNTTTTGHLWVGSGMELSRLVAGIKSLMDRRLVTAHRERSGAPIIAIFHRTPSSDVRHFPKPRI